MAKLDHGKANRSKNWQQSVRNVWSGHVPRAIEWPTEKQINYLQALLVKAGRREFTPAELKMLTKASASRLIDEFTKKA